MLASRFFDALRDGDVEALREVLAADVQLVGDAEARSPHWPAPWWAWTRSLACSARSSPT